MKFTIRAAPGFSLIEIMIALVLGTILILGLTQVFAASRSSYALSEGLSRVQENGRFAIDYLQRDLRMVGHFGCANDQFRLQRNGLLDSHLAAAGPLDFSRSIQGYEADDTGPGATITLLTDAEIQSPGSWSGTPALPAFISGANPAPLPDSDVLVVRFLSGEGVPVTTVSAAGITVDPVKWNVLTQGGVANPALFGIADCTYADVFQATTVAAGAITATNSGLNTTAVDFNSRYTASPAGQTMLYRAESLAYYVAPGAGGGPSLWRLRFHATPGGAIVSNPEELIEGIENMQLIYGRDQGAASALTGNIGIQNTANTLGAIDAEWLRVGQIRIGLLARSPDRSSASQATENQRVLGTMVAPSDDARYRAVYETTIALRNRLYSTQ